MKRILPLLLFSVIIFISCEEVYFDRPAIIGKKMDSFPTEMQGVYNIAFWQPEKKKWEHNPEEKSDYIFLHPTELIYDEQADTSSPDNFRIVFDGKHNIISYKKGKYYFSQMEIRDNTRYYIMRMLEPRKEGVYLKFILMRFQPKTGEATIDTSMRVKMKKTFKLIREQPEHLGDYEGRVEYFFNMDEKKLERLFEKEIPDTAAFLLIKKD